MNASPPQDARRNPESEPPPSAPAAPGPEGRAPSASASQIVHWMGPTDANSAGNVHGGVVMKLTDEVAGITAMKHSRRRVVTVGMDRMNFLVPVYVGELVTFCASVNAAWRSSMEVGVRVEAENPRTGVIRHTNTAYVTMVALDEEGNPVPVPPLRPETPDEHRRQSEAELRRANRLAERDEILARRGASMIGVQPSADGAAPSR